MFSRRQLLASLSAVFAGMIGNRSSLAKDIEISRADSLKKVLESSDLVYITPLRRNGEESHCHGEVWFVHEGADLYVVTATERWRAEAVRRGLHRARLWVGDYGTWTKAKEKYRQAPELEASVTIENDKQLTERLLERFGDKYPMGWIVYGRRFRKGLADGSRVLLRYSIL